MTTPKPRPCMSPGCPFMARSRGRRCAWHHLDNIHIGDQVTAARARLALVPEELRRPRVPEREWPAGSRWCASCQSFVPRFYSRGSRCQACASDAAHSAMLPKTYGIDAQEYDRLLALQGGRCAICGQRPQSKRLAVDHAHDTGEVRGLLCARDNHETLGGAFEKPFRLRAAAFYLENPPTSGRWIDLQEQEKIHLPIDGAEHAAPTTRAEADAAFLDKLKKAGITTDELVSWAMRESKRVPF